MKITTELEKLAELRDCGDLSEEEFEKAKALLLYGEKAESISTTRLCPDPRTDREKKKKTMLLVALLATLAAAFSAGSVIIAPSLVSAGNLIFWVGLSSYGWISHLRLKV